MISEERLLTVLCIPHVSEKTSSAMDKVNTVVFKVVKSATKKEIKDAIQKLFEVKVEKVNTLIVKKKVRRNKKPYNRHSSWKKAYVTVKRGQSLDFFSSEIE